MTGTASMLRMALTSEAMSGLVIGHGTERKFDQRLCLILRAGCIVDRYGQIVITVDQGEVEEQAFVKTTHAA
jgi:hypothetical protein